MKTSKRLMLSALLLGLSMPLLAATGLRPQIKTAVAHAKMAKAASGMTLTQMHLQHVVNCLVGPQGKQFDAAAGNPCKGEGNGAMVDASTLQRIRLKSALGKAEKGIAAKQEWQALKAAGQTIASLQAFLGKLPAPND